MDCVFAKRLYTYVKNLANTLKEFWQYYRKKKHPAVFCFDFSEISEFIFGEHREFGFFFQFCKNNTLKLK